MKERITISLEEKLIKKIDQCKDYPMWGGNRSAIIGCILNEHFLKK